MMYSFVECIQFWFFADCINIFDNIQQQNEQ